MYKMNIHQVDFTLNNIRWLLNKKINKKVKYFFFLSTSTAMDVEINRSVNLLFIYAFWKHVEKSCDVKMNAGSAGVVFQNWFELFWVF